MRYTEIRHLPQEDQERAREALRARGALQDPPKPRASLHCGHGPEDVVCSEGHNDGARHTPTCIQWCEACSQDTPR